METIARIEYKVLLKIKIVIIIITIIITYQLYSTEVAFTGI